MEPLEADNPPSATDKDPYMVEALAHGLAVLRVFDNAQTDLNLTEIAQRLGWSRTKPYRYIYTLERMGYLRRDEGTKRYRPTSLTMTLGYAYLSGMSLLEVAQPILNHLKDSLGASVHMGILEQGETVYIASARVSVAPAVNIQVGSRVPLHATSIGRVLLAHLDGSEVDALIGQGPLPALTPRSTTDPRAFRAMLELSRAQGYVFTDEEFHLGVRSVAAPVRDRSGKVSAAINATSIVHKFSDQYTLEMVVPQVRQAADQISMSLGFRA